MPYVATIPVVFPYSKPEVYRALCNLEMYPLWNSGMKSISTTQMMEVGLRYKTETTVAGHVNISEIEVVRLVPEAEIELEGHSGLISYRCVFLLKKQSAETTEVVCSLRFEFRNFVLDLARPVIEAMAQARVRGDLEMLRALLADGSSN